MGSTASAAPPPSLRDHLRSARPPFGRPIHLILGNEAADLDSVACALALAHAWRSRDPGLLTVPVLNIPRAELSLRRDVRQALRYAGLRPDDLVFADDLPGGAARALAPRGALTLVDHNALAPAQRPLAPFVRAVVDHHRDERLFPAARPRLVEPVGSCATLVARLVGDAVAPQVARLLLCAVLVDTANLSPAFGKATAEDIAAVERLRAPAGWDPAACEEVFERLRAARADVTGFSVAMLLRKDLKVFAARGLSAAIASIVLSAEAFARRAQEVDDDPLTVCAEQFRTQLGVDCLATLMAYSDGESFRRELGVLKGEVGDRLQALLFEEAALGLQRMEVPRGDGLWWFSFKDARMSRKVVAPAFLKVMEQLAGAGGRQEK